MNSAAVKRTGGAYMAVSSTAVSSAIRRAGGVYMTVSNAIRRAGGVYVAQSAVQSGGHVAVSSTAVSSAVRSAGGVYAAVSSTAVSSAIRSAGGSLHVALREVTWCIVVWCGQELRRDGCSFMWHQPCQRCKYTTSVDI